MKYKLRSQNTNDDIIKLICENRDVDFNKLEEFLNPKKDSILNPLIYRNMDRACKRILEAVRNNQKIGIVIDSDADGYCSSAMLINYLWDVFKFGNFVFFMHQDKTHGLKPHIMNMINDNPVELVILPDASSNDYEQHKELSLKGIDVIVIDHHEADKESEYAIVVNNQLNMVGNKTLSGGGMVLKVLEHLDTLTGNEASENYYDLASVAMVADSMLMTNNETRYYVQQGLKNMNNQLLIELYKGNATRDFEMISFDIAPTINAFIRVGTKEEREDLFYALVGRTDMRNISIRGQGTFELTLPEYIAKLASRVKSRQSTLINKALESSETLVYTEELPITICILDTETPKQLTGLIGNRFVELYNKPTLVLKAENGKYSGSGRSTDTFENFRDYINKSNKFEFAEGHAGAFGCSIISSNLVDFMNSIRGTILEEGYDSYVVEKAYFNSVSAYEIIAVSELNNHWAKGFEKPRFYIKLTGLTNKDIDIIGQKRDTIRIKHNHITYIKFKCSQEEIEKLKSTNVNEVEIIGSFSVNEWMDRLYPQVHIEELEIKGSEKSKNVEFFGSSFGGFGNIKW